MKAKLMIFAMAAALLATFAMAPLTAGATGRQTHTGSLTAPVTGTYTDPTTGSVGSFTGTMTITKFAADATSRVLTASGTITGVVDYTSGTLANTTQSITTTFTAPVDPTCPILSLTVGPIHLDLLGLVLNTNTIQVNLTAQSGPGNLLGNLLCAVTNALNGNASQTALNQIVGLLNQILASL
ncbi:MAG TPA: hypothetical protein VFN57_09765 [Thermomicrobiaceae bacterium]|nr:hypothetical protein [Thermomicrobiaceae bacterium]